jgi:hypothetical protein
VTDRQVRGGDAVDASRFRLALGRHAAGVAVITGPGPVGLIATSLTSVSLDRATVSTPGVQALRFVKAAAPTHSGVHGLADAPIGPLGAARGIPRQA